MVRFSDLSNLRFSIGCETPQNMHLLIYSRIFAKNRNYIGKYKKIINLDNKEQEDGSCN